MCEECKQIMASFPEELHTVMERYRSELMALGERMQKDMGNLLFTVQEPHAEVPKERVEYLKACLPVHQNMLSLIAVCGYVAASTHHDAVMVQELDQLYDIATQLGWAKEHVAMVERKLN